MKPGMADAFTMTLPPKPTTSRPRPAPVAPEVAAAYAGIEVVAKEPRRPSRMRAVASGERLTVYLDPELATRLRVRCARERRSLSDAAIEAFEAWAKE